jgi:D-hydroxyproline dehydrogenase
MAAAPPIKTDVAIVGAGIVGLAVAFGLAAAGREVVVIDPNEPGSGASYGNAGTLAPYAVTPVGNPDVLRYLPHLLLAPRSPFAVHLPGLPLLVPWMLRFASQSLPGPARRNAYALATLQNEAMPAWRELAEHAELSDLIRANGCLYLFRARVPDDKGSWSFRLRGELGVRQERLSAADVAKLEPSLPPAAGGLFFPDAAHILDPAVLTKRLAAAAQTQGAVFIRAKGERLEPRDGGVIRVPFGDRAVDAQTAILAAGAWSRSLARSVGDDIPLDTERGYHIEFAVDPPPVGRPISPVDLGFYVTPMAGRLRVAGLVELGGLSAPLNPRRIAQLESGARKLFPGLGPVQSQWLGFRPSMPDSLPVIGRSGRCPNVIFAFGHGHLGMTLAAITSRIVSDLIERRYDAIDLRAFRSDRFA